MTDTTTASPGEEPTGAPARAVYNPLASGDFTSPTDRIMPVREWTESHYERLAARFAKTAFKVLASRRGGHK